MLVSILITTAALIAMQVVLVIKLADWLSQESGSLKGHNAVVAGAGNGRFAGIA
ncbi:hypothetical protein ACLBWX_00790 [Methylobacterium sp. M6A4_1b]